LPFIREFKSGTILESCILMLCSALSLFWYLGFVAAYLGNIADRYVDVNGSGFFKATFEICRGNV
jgi:hypothetical protein